MRFIRQLTGMGIDAAALGSETKPPSGNWRCSPRTALISSAENGCAAACRFSAGKNQQLD
jgi:hypothetical protein